MAATGSEQRPEWILEQIQTYRQLHPRYLAYAHILRKVLEAAAARAAPLAIIQTRPKSIPSFAEKAMRKRTKYSDPLVRMTDLCGGRIITQTQDQVRAVSHFLEQHFDVDLENSVDVSQRLKPSEFGYRSIHYVVQFRRGEFPCREAAVEIPDEIYPDADCPMKAEIQVRTVLEHAWAGFGHDRIYKSAFAIPAHWQRELAVLAGMLEEVDQAFSRIQAGLERYAASYADYMEPDQMRAEIEILETVLGCDPGNVELAHRIGKLAMCLGDWSKAEDVLSRNVESGHQPTLRDLGVVLCKVHAGDPGGAQYRQGQNYLEAASSDPYQDADALASLAGTWKAIDHNKARELYRKAFEVDPTDPYAVSNFLVQEITHRQDLEPVTLMVPALHAAIQRSRDQAEVGMNQPWAYYNLGLFHLLLDRPFESLNAYAKAIQASNDPWMVATSLRTLDRLDCVRASLSGFEWARRILLVGQAARSSSDEAAEQLRGLASPGLAPISAPVILAAGGCDAGAEDQMQGYLQFMLEAFQGYRGTLISGGTSSGIGGLVAEVRRSQRQGLRAVGYVPEHIPVGVSTDPRYDQILTTPGSDFSVLEPLQIWIDLLASGIRPAEVRVLGINGGTIAAFEYRLALALGARVAIVDGSGREASKLARDQYWADSPALIFLPPDPMAARAAFNTEARHMEAALRETLAEAIHEAYRAEQAYGKSNLDPVMLEWDRLLESLKEGNRRQADHIAEKLTERGYALRRAKGKKPRLARFTPEDVEVMARMEHGRWLVERLQDGWKWSAERDMLRKTTPYLVPWSQLPEPVREWDRQAVRQLPEHLARVRMEIVRRDRPD